MFIRRGDIKNISANTQSKIASVPNDIAPSSPYTHSVTWMDASTKVWYSANITIESNGEIYLTTETINYVSPFLFSYVMRS